MTTKNISIEQEHPEINKDITLLKRILLPLEMHVLKTIIKKEKPVSVRTLYVEKLLDTYVDYIEWQIQKATKKDYQPNLKGVVESHTLPHNYLELKKIIDDIKFQRQKDMIHSSQTRTIEQVLRKEKIKFPSYHLVQSACETLLSWNIISKRQEEEKVSKNESFFLILNPAFFLKHENELSKLI